MGREVFSKAMSQATHLKIPDTGKSSRQWLTGSSSSCSADQRKVRPSQAAQEVLTALLPVCSRAPALRSADSWCQTELGRPGILLEHACHPVSTRQQGC